MPTSLRITSTDIEALPDQLDDTRYELIAGELFVSKQPHWAHQFASLMLGAALQDWNRRTRWGGANERRDREVKLNVRASRSTGSSTGARKQWKPTAAPAICSNRCSA